MRFFLLFVVLAACAAAPKAAPEYMQEPTAPLLAKQGAIGGLVRDASNGLLLSMVTVQAEQDGAVVAHDVSDYKGRYRLNPLPPGHYRIRARFANAQVLYEDVVVQKQEETLVRISVDLRQQADRSTTIQSEGQLGTIQGSVVDGVDGAQVPGTLVSLHATHLPEPISAIADQEGRFRFKALRPGSYSLSCYYNLVKQGNVEIRRNNIAVKPGQHTDVQLKLDLRIR